MGPKKGASKSQNEADKDPLSMVSDQVAQDIAIKNEFDNLCRELNMDTSTAETAWESYIEVKHKYTLEVRQQCLVHILK